MDRLHIDSRLNNNPCFNKGKDCPDRNGTCHCTCEKWKKWAKLRDQYREERYEENKKWADVVLARESRAKINAYKQKHRRCDRRKIL